jgi:Icc-related predicted phosphoesterase
MRIAAVGDVHVGHDSVERLTQDFAPLGEQADVLLLAGDLTRCGDPAEAKLLAGVLADVPVPVVAVLGNHDVHAEREDEVRSVLEDVGVTLLEGGTATLTLPGEDGPERLGVAGTKGFGGGFPGATGSEFGERIMKDFMRETARHARRLEEGLARLAAGIDGGGPVDARVALMHFAPVRDTLRGEHPEVYPFLGSYLLGEAVDRAGADLVLHGHAHLGTERGVTPGGIRVRNVAQPVIRSGYEVFHLVPHRHATPQQPPASPQPASVPSNPW